MEEMLWITLLFLNVPDASALCGTESLRRLIDSARLRSSVEHLKAGRVYDRSDLTRAIVANSAELPAIEKSVLSKTMPRAEAESVRRGFREANAKVQEIRRAYPELANVTGVDEARLIALITKLEERRAPREKIREALERGQKACRVR